MPRFGRKRAKPSVITLADRARDQGQWERAAGYYRIALHRNPQNPPIWVQYGHMLKESGHLAEAERAYRTALAYDPGNADSHLQLGHLLKVQGKCGEEQSSYLRALLLEPSAPHPSHELRGFGWSKPQISELLTLLPTHDSETPYSIKVTPDEALQHSPEFFTPLSSAEERKNVPILRPPDKRFRPHEEDQVITAFRFQC
jgi:tetratricopeptide (TPR) repeat protein